MNNLEFFLNLGPNKINAILIDKEGYEFARGIGYIDFENKSFLNWLSSYL